MESQTLSCNIEVTWYSQSTAQYRIESPNRCCSQSVICANLQGGPVVQLQAFFSDTCF